MSLFDLEYRDTLQSISPKVATSGASNELESLSQRMSAWALVEHNEDGTHNLRPSGFDFVPIGSMVQWPNNTPPLHWLTCDGSQVSRLTYAALFKVLGTTYGVGDGSTTYNLPDLRQRFPLGKASAGTGSTLGSTGGTIDHTHSVPALSVPGLSIPALSVPALSVPSLSVPALSVPGLSVPSLTASVSGTTASAGAHTHSGATGSEAGHTHGVSGTVATTNVGNTVNINIGAAQLVTTDFHDHAFSVTSGAGSSHSHSISSDGAHTHTVTSTGTTGTGTTGTSVTGTGSTGTGVTGTGVTGTGTTGTSVSGTGTTGANNAPYLVINFIILSGV